MKIFSIIVVLLSLLSSTAHLFAKGDSSESNAVNALNSMFKAKDFRVIYEDGDVGLGYRTDKFYFEARKNPGDDEQGFGLTFTEGNLVFGGAYSKNDLKGRLYTLGLSYVGLLDDYSYYGATGKYRKFSATSDYEDSDTFEGSVFGGKYITNYLIGQNTIGVTTSKSDTYDRENSAFWEPSVTMFHKNIALKISYKDQKGGKNDRTNVNLIISLGDNPSKPKFSDLVDIAKANAATDIANSHFDDSLVKATKSTGPIWDSEIIASGVSVTDANNNLTVIQDLSAVSSDPKGATITYSIVSVSSVAPADKTKFENSLSISGNNLVIQNLQANDPGTSGTISVVVKATSTTGSNNATITFNFNDIF